MNFEEDGNTKKLFSVDKEEKLKILRGFTDACVSFDTTYQENIEILCMN
jgi:hypothetical protein